MLQTRQQQVIDRCKEIFDVAARVYGLDMSRVRIGFGLTGRAAGVARSRPGAYGPEYSVDFNREMMTREAFDHVLNNTVPHELAHIACFMNPLLGKNHNSGWEAVCKKLGGTGKTRHSEKIIFGKGNTYEYITDRGHAVRIGERHHHYVQNTGALKFRHNKGSITRTSSYHIVGMRGVALATPIPKLAANHPAVIEDCMRASAAQALKQATITPVAAQVGHSGSKASVSREIMLSGFNNGKSYEDIIAAMIAANGYNRALARATFKANAHRVGIPSSFC